MPTPKDYRIQAGVGDELARALKIHAVLNNMLLFDVFVEAMQQFIPYRQELKRNGESVAYLSSPTGAKDINVHLPAKLASRLRAMAEEDNQPFTRLLYTALVHFAVGQNLVPPIGTVQSGVVNSGGPSIAEMVRASKNKRRQG